MKSAVWRASLGLLLAITTGWCVTAVAQRPPAVGRFLVATRQQHGFFAHSVILLIAYGRSGALGVVINHPTKLTLAEALPDPEILRGRGDLLYLGGPVALDGLTLLIRSRHALPQATQVLTDVYASGSPSALRTAVGEKLTRANFRAYAGYAGWAPGQLDAELKQGAWTVAPADAGEVFTATPATLWDRLSVQGNAILVWVAPSDARVIRPSRVE